MRKWNTYQDSKKNSKISPAEKMDGVIYNIESDTDYDVLNITNHSIEIINRFGDDNEIKTVNISHKTTGEIIQLIKNL